MIARPAQALVATLAAVASLLVTACGSGLPTPHNPVPPGQDPDEFAALEVFAARNLSCPAEKVAYQGKANRHYFAGCGDRVEMMMMVGDDARAMGYAKGFALPSPTTRFAKETKCPMEASSVERIDFRTRIVEGCGQRITYVNACDFHGCSWIANVESHPR